MSKQVFRFFLLFIVFSWESFGAPNLRIIGGHDAVRGQFPYQVSIQIMCDYGPCLPDCGGTIINERWILTAASCVRSNANDTIVVAGLLKVSDIDAKAQTAGVEKTITHPYYSKNTLMNYNNLALWKLNSSFVFDEFVQPVQLPEEGSIATGMATLSGWGKSGNTGAAYPEILQTLDVPIISYEECAMALINFSDFSKGFKLNNTIDICTADTTEIVENASACHGDNGGPLTQNGTLVGVVSNTFSPCGRIGFPNLYARVSSYVSWIKQAIENQEWTLM